MMTQVRKPSSSTSAFLRETLAVLRRLNDPKGLWWAMRMLGSRFEDRAFLGAAWKLREVVGVESLDEWCKSGDPAERKAELVTAILTTIALVEEDENRLIFSDHGELRHPTVVSAALSG